MPKRLVVLLVLFLLALLPLAAYEIGAGGRAKEISRLRDQNNWLGKQSESCEL